jgi:hypothetical protein
MSGHFARFHSILIFDTSEAPARFSTATSDEIAL